MADKSKKFLKNTLFLIELDVRGTTTNFYNKKKRHDKKISFCSNF